MAVCVTVRAPAGRAAEVVAVLHQPAPLLTRAQPGFVLRATDQDLDDPSQLFVLVGWRSADEQEAAFHGALTPLRDRLRALGAEIEHFRGRARAEVERDARRQRHAPGTACSPRGPNVTRLHHWRGSATAGLAVVTLAIFTDMLLYGLAVPILPGYAAGMGVSDWAIGLLFGSYAFALVLATPVLGWLCDRTGRRALMVAGLFGLAVATLLFAVATSYLGLLAARLVQGVAAGATWTAGLALVADLYPSKERGRAMGIALSGMTGGFLLGPPLGGLLYEWGGYSAPFVIVAGLAVVDGLARLLLLADPPAREQAHPPLLGLLRDRRILLASGTVALGAATWGLLEPVLPLYLERQLGMTPAAIGLLFGGATIAYGVAAPAVGTASDRWGRRPLMAAGLALLALALPLLVLPQQALLASGALVLVAVAYGVSQTPALPELGDAVDRYGGGGYATVYALFNETYSIGMMAGPAVGAAVASAFGLATAFALVGAVLLAYVPLLLLGSRQAAGAPPAAEPDG